MLIFYFPVVCIHKAWTQITWKISLSVLHLFLLRFTYTLYMWKWEEVNYFNIFLFNSVWLGYTNYIGSCCNYIRCKFGQANFPIRFAFPSHFCFISVNKKIKAPWIYYTDLYASYRKVVERNTFHFFFFRWFVWDPHPSS